MNSKNLSVKKILTENLVLVQLKTKNLNCYFFLLENQTKYFLLYFCAKFRICSYLQEPKSVESGIQNLSYSQDSSQDFYLYTDIHPFTTDVTSGANPIGHMGNAAYQ